MYIDGVVLFGVITVIATCAVVVYLGFYTCRHIKRDAAKETAVIRAGDNPRR